MTIPLYKGIVIYKGIYIVKSQILRDFISKIIFRQGFLREETIFFIHFFFFIFVCIFTIQKNTNPIIIIKSVRANSM